MKITCGNCRFWKRDDDQDDELGEDLNGECHRRAPLAVVISDVAHSKLTDTSYYAPMWPKVFLDDFCGEFEPRPGS